MPEEKVRQTPEPVIRQESLSESECSERDAGSGTRWLKAGEPETAFLKQH